MSRFVTFVVTGTIALALASVAGPVSPVLDRPADSPVAGTTTGKKTGNWCC
jgi:hypothetical protein